MKLYLSVDMEGITGLPDYTFVSASMHNYERARKIMTDETNYVVDAAFQSGCAEVLVNDSHMKMNNILIDQLHPEAELITGGIKTYSMVHGLDDSFSGAMFIGYHTRAGMPGVMSHSMIHMVRNFYINDTQLGEIGMNAMVAGYHGVPVLLVSGDDETAKEAEELIPNITTAVVKEAVSRSATKSLTPKKAGELLQGKVKQAIENRHQVKPLLPPDNPVLKIEFVNYGAAELAHMMPGTEIIPGTTIVTYQAKDILEAYRALLVMIELAYYTQYA
ncbi:M55 family metallopeptidase [Ornithinibacillus sp. BX22]|uniref:M55 family metallopeptidase n=2 Tax=Ornithinibacillus TaxID=484508 RepID=A0A923RID8_9BACI|nr:MULTISPECIES: M55 family metallopeptidase [Ornithinibacillus]MBC5635647.1 M55 family metallopeptidase [Ornithinibacillus hominis]MBS3679258.1 M55 family metallopeptidase [Ornithinibacillus massiliensis]